MTETASLRNIEARLQLLVSTVSVPSPSGYRATSEGPPLKRWQGREHYLALFNSKAVSFLL